MAGFMPRTAIAFILATLALTPTAPNAAPKAGAVSAVWANDGGDKVTRDEVRAHQGRDVRNSIWDGAGIRLFGARNEIVSFNLILEAADRPAPDVSVVISDLTGPNGSTIHSSPSPTPDGVFTWVDRNIELFLVRYLQIRGLSAVSYETYDERHIPIRLRRPSPNGSAGKDGEGGWTDRPDHDRFYPEIAVPLELSPEFQIASGENQSIWADIAIPKSSPPGLYSGTLIVRERGVTGYEIPVALTVRSFALPDVPASKTAVATSYAEVARRYTGNAQPSPGSPADRLARKVMNRQFMLAHRHGIALIDDNGGAVEWLQTRPRPDWIPRLDGTLFTAANGYSGPGEGIGNGVFSVGTYGAWQSWWGDPPSRAAVWRATDAWEQWFAANAPEAERFLYISDESDDYAQTEEWANWLKSNPGPGHALKSFATVPLAVAAREIPSLDIAASTLSLGDPRAWQSALDAWRGAGKSLHLYNGQRPASGSFATEDDGVALRELAWGQEKKGIDRWFYWNATYYDDYQGGRGETNVFQTAQTFGGQTEMDPVLGLTGWNASNGDGVLFYPGTDAVFPSESYGLAGPIASLRLKHWRRGIHDVAYIHIARSVNPDAVAAIIERMVPKVLWETGVGDPSDPTWVHAPISWSTDPDDWEAARAELADIIERSGGTQ
jgi:hypothetical protein